MGGTSPCWVSVLWRILASIPSLQPTQPRVLIPQGPGEGVDPHGGYQSPYQRREIRCPCSSNIPLAGMEL